jgi:hypothetical protein
MLRTLNKLASTIATLSESIATIFIFSTFITIVYVVSTNSLSTMIFLLLRIWKVVYLFFLLLNVNVYK